MMLSYLAILPFVASAVAQTSTPSVVCVAGQCLQGFSNVTIGATLSAPGQPSLHLLPGQYTSTTNPQLLHTLLTSSSASLSPSAGINASLSTLPLNLQLSPGLSIFSDVGYSGQSSFTALPSSPLNNSVPLSAKSIALAENVYAALSTGNNGSRIVLWDSVPDLSQLPSSLSTTQLSLVKMESTTCSPSCSGSSICSPSGTCVCPEGFTGNSCESCLPGHFGPSCTPCAGDCAQCDEGISGSGRCLKANITGAPETCGCQNGVCNPNGSCTCNAGFVTADNGTSCAKCADGFFLTSTGDCKACQLGCSKCSDTTGTCISCSNGFTQNTSDRTKCDSVPTSTSTGTVCPDGSFADGAKCSPCASACNTCKGGTSNDCTLCAKGSYMFNGACVSADGNGICEGSGGFVADNNKNVCDTCGAKCTSCQIPSFNVASTINELKCTTCLPGSFLSNGQCVDSCPSGTFVDPKDNMTCTTCDSSCTSCSGSSTFCLSCPSGQVASNGKCLSSCPPTTFPTPSSSSCTTCHPDCASCSGPSFNQCSTCPPDRPVLSNGRCLATCGKGSYFDATTSSCQTCDGSCGSCSGPGAGACLSCSSDSQVVKGGSCVDAQCSSGTSVVSGLGMCLSTLVVLPKSGGTDTNAPLPTITGISDPTVINTKRSLEWWQILLMALGCAFIFVVFLFCWRRRARQRRAMATREFAKAKQIGGKGWKWRLVRFGEKLFGHKRSPVGGAVYTHAHGLNGEGRERRSFYRYRDEYDEVDLDLERGGGREMKMGDLKYKDDAKSWRTEDDDGGSYYPKPKSKKSYTPSSLPSLGGRRLSPRDERDRGRDRLSDRSMFSEITGVQRNTPEPRVPVKSDLGAVAPQISLPLSQSKSHSGSSPTGSPTTIKQNEQLRSRFSESTVFTLSAYTQPNAPLVDLDDTPPPVPKMPTYTPTEAERIVTAVRPGLLAGIQNPQSQATGTGYTPAPPATFTSFLTSNPGGAITNWTGMSAPTLGAGATAYNGGVTNTLTGASAPAGLTQSTGSYWTQPIQPSSTGASGSKNPFRQ